jgi:hypothetical protein
MTRRDYVSHTEDWFRGKRARVLRALRSGALHIVPGSIVTIDRKWSGFTIRSETCKHCGVSVFMTKVGPECLELV